jgi:hypothetical protein
MTNEKSTDAEIKGRCKGIRAELKDKNRVIWFYKKDSTKPTYGIDAGLCLETLLKSDRDND